MSKTAHIPFREVPYLPLKLKMDRRPDGTIYLESGLPLKAYPPHMLAPLVKWAAERPDQVWLAERWPEDPAQDSWRRLTYAEGLAAVRRIAAAFLSEGAGPDAPVMILSKNSIDNALVMYAGMWASSPVVPVTPAYATLSQDLVRFRYIDDLTSPKFIYVEDGKEYQRALDALDLTGRTVIYSRNAPDVPRAVSLEDFAGQTGLFLVAVDADALGAALRWEPSRNGELFPHLYGELDLGAVTGVQEMLARSDGYHDVPELEP